MLWRLFTYFETLYIFWVEDSIKVYLKLLRKANKLYLCDLFWDTILLEAKKSRIRGDPGRIVNSTSENETLNMEEQIAKLQTKLKLLNFTAKKTDSTIAKADIEVSERLCSSIKAMIKAVSDVKETIEEQKFKSGATVEIVSEWSDEIEQQIEFADEQVRKITNQIREINYEFKQAEDVKKRDAQLEFERARVELQQQHEKHERDEQIAQEAKILDKKLQYQNYSKNRKLALACQQTEYKPNCRSYR